jgi:hypothetical protein
LIYLFEQLEDADGAPTEGIESVYGERAKLLKEYEAEWQRLVKEDLADLAGLARKLEVPGVIVPAKP